MEEKIATLRADKMKRQGKSLNFEFSVGVVHETLSLSLSILGCKI